MNYHASGIKVNDNESLVGTGWSLDAGGIITRVMRGRPDEDVSGFINNAEKVPSATDFAANYNDSLCHTKDSLNAISENLFDYEPDIFYYNFPGFSGSFTFDNNGGIQIRPMDKIKIQTIFEEGIIAGFIITNTEGLVYTFSDNEITNVNIKGTIPRYTSSWYLTQIFNPLTDRVINFYYTSFQGSAGISHSWSVSQKKIYKQILSHYEFTSDEFSSTTSAVISEKYPSSIVFGSNAINFFISANSTHTTSHRNDQRLDSINIFNINKRVKGFILSYEYKKPQIESRLFLNSFSETAGSIVKKYDFYYDNQSLPDRNSYSIDHWGFYNGAQNSELIPPQLIGNQIVCTADRTPHWPYTKAGVLNKIVYPTGGISEFEFENNKYTYSGNYPTVQKSSTINATGNLNSEKCETKVLNDFSDDSVYSDLKIITSVSDQDPYALYNFEINNEFSDRIRGPYIEEVNKLPPHYGRFDFRTDGRIYFNNSLVESGITHEATIDSIPDYEAIIFKACASDHLTSTNSVFYYKVRKKGTTTYDDPGGGLRIKKVITYTPGSNDTILKTFDYNHSGYLTSGFPTYNVDTWHTIGYGSILTYHYKMLYSTPVSGLGVSGNSVAYSKVTEYSGNEDSNKGKIDTEYLIRQDDGYTSDYYYSPSLSSQWFRSKVSKETIFRNNNGSYEPVQKDLFEYTVTDGSNVIGFKASRKATQESANTAPPCLFDEFGFNNINIMSFNLLPSKKIHREFFSVNDSIETSSRFYYDTVQLIKHYQPIFEKTTNSRMEVIKTKTVFPSDTVYISANDPTGKIFRYMERHNLLTLPITKSIYVNGSKRKEYSWKYDTIQINKLTLRKAEELVDLVPVTTYRTIMSYEQYDNYGNPISIIGQNGINTVYIWGYNKELLVAKIENATIDQVQTLFGGTIPDLGIVGLSQSQSNLLRNGLPKALVTTYNHEPLIGLLSETFPNGVTTYYEYDKLGRLKLIRDDGGRILKTFEYNYAH
jgi:YD repeat-containing protein